MTNGVEQPSAPLTKLLAGGVGSVTAGLGAFGTLTGGLERSVRNYPVESVALIVVGSVAIGLGVVGPAISKRIPDKVLAGGVTVLLVVGVLFGILVVGGASTTERPSVSGSLAVAGDQVTVKGQVDASGLKSSEHMLVKVEGEKAGYDTVVYVARVGPNSEGKVKAPVETVVPRSSYDELILSAQLQGKISERERDKEAVQDCGDETPYWGCVRLLVPVPTK